MPASQKSVLVILSGCGYLDGAEIHEAVITLLTLTRAGASWKAAAPDKAQMHVVNHATGQVEPGATRNVLAESARIARGNILPLAKVDVADYDAVFIPGGFGAAKNLSTLAVEGPYGTADPDLVRVLSAFHRAGKPIGAVCIAPAVLVQAIGHELDAVTVTIGDDPGTAGAISAMGGQHLSCPVTELCVDGKNKVVTAPAYMYDATIADVATGIEKAVRATLEMCS